MTQMQRIRPLNILLNKGRERKRRRKGKRKRGRKKGEKEVQDEEEANSTGQPGPGHSDVSCTSVARKVLCLELRTEPGRDGEEVAGYTLYVITTPAGAMDQHQVL